MYPLLCHPSSYLQPLFVTSLIGTFSYMSADYRNYRNLSVGWHVGAVLGQTFTAPFLDIWEAFNAVAVLRDRYARRWVISWFEHEGLQHIISNLLLFWMLGSYLERQYGTAWLTIISGIAGLGGNLMSALLNDPCNQVVGASGIIFGLAGFWVADLVVNFHFIRSLPRHIALVSVFFALFLVTVLARSNVSNWSHLGGLLAGSFPAFVVLPRLGRRRLEAVMLYVGLGGLIIYFGLLFPLAYFYRAPQLLLTESPAFTCT